MCSRAVRPPVRRRQRECQRGAPGSSLLWSLFPRRWEEIAGRCMFPLPDHNRAHILNNRQPVLLVAARLHFDDADVVARSRLSDINDLSFGIQSVAAVERVREPNPVPSKSEAVLTDISDAEAGDNGERKRAVDDAPPER